MSRSHNRRRFLRGAGGLAIGLPFLETFAGKKAWAAPPKRFAVYFQCNGVNKDRWWPKAFGALTPDSLVGTALEPIKAHAARLLIPRPLNGFPKGYGQDGVPVDDHNLGMCAKLTCAPPHTASDNAKGPSIDDVIAKSLNPGGRGPLLLHVGETSGGRIGNAFYTPSGQPAVQEPNPWNAFKSWVGSGTAAPPGMPMVDYLALKKKSVLDVVKEDLKALQGSPLLGRADKQKLDMHFGAVRSLEAAAGGGVTPVPGGPVLACTLGDARNKEIEAGGGDFVKNAAMMMEIAAIALACGYNRVVGIQMSVGAGGPRYDWLPDALNKIHRHHPLSHGATADDVFMPTLPEAEYKTALFNIDTWHMQTFNLLLTKLAAYTEPGGSVLDNSAVLYINELSNGLAHSHEELPILVAGSAGGALKQGQYVNITRLIDPDAYGKPSTPPFFITLANALGYRDAAGAPMMKFGNPTARGRVPQAGEHAELKA